MIIGCFALIEPFTEMQRQFDAIRELGIRHADITDNHDGASLGVEYGFAASVSLDSHPARIRDMARRAGITLTALWAHANLLDPTSPDVYGTMQIIKAIRLASLLGIKQVITSEGDPKTAFGQQLTRAERLFAILEKLQAPIEWAEELGIELLLETHGKVTDSLTDLGDLLDALGHEKTVGVCLDTGNCWLGGSEPLDYIRAFGGRIRHVHWKDLGAEWIAKRSQLFGCGMSTIALGQGVIGISEIVQALQKANWDGSTTLEIAGADNVRASVEYLEQWLGS